MLSRHVQRLQRRVGNRYAIGIQFCFPKIYFEAISRKLTFEIFFINSCAGLDFKFCIGTFHCIGLPNEYIQLVYLLRCVKASLYIAIRIYIRPIQLLDTFDSFITERSRCISSIVNICIVPENYMRLFIFSKFTIDYKIQITSYMYYIPTGEDF